MFKLVGPVLVKQDQNEAKQNVNTRLEFIQGEMCVFVLVLIHIPIPISIYIGSIYLSCTDGPRRL